MVDAGFFDFDNMVANLVSNPLEDKSSKWGVDERFYVLPKDDKGEGSAIIAFLPDPEGRPLQRMYKINTTIIKDGQRRFCNEWSPTTINARCPFQEAWQKLYNAGQREESRKFARSTRYIANILVVKDPCNPENEGKVFLYDMSQRFKDKLEQAVNPTQQDIALGATRKEIFNPTRGWVMRLIARKQGNDMVTYDYSEFVHSDPVWPDPEVAFKNITEKCYKLSDLLKPENFKSYDELKAEFNRVTFADGTGSSAKNESEVLEASSVAPKVEVKEQAQQPQQTQQPKSELDELLKDLV